jgi:hypothetical protein
MVNGFGDCKLTDHIKTSHVSIELHVVLINLDVVVRVDSMRSHQEAKQSGFRVNLLDHVKDSHDYIVTSCSLTTTQNYCNLEVKS